mmetsp:Transcript_9395/g.14163  ORF Transcript_9395/g.14163 Transcript_9395/m.14163 type:complete len:468 (+) Transcript_9395:53-1456(+)
MVSKSLTREVAIVSSLASNSNDKSQGHSISVVDPQNSVVLASFKGNRSKANSLALCGKDYIFSAQSFGTSIFIWSWGMEQVKFKCPTKEKLCSLNTSSDGGFCICGGFSGKIYIWEIGSGTLIHSWDAHYKAVTVLTFSNDNCTIYSGSVDAMVSSWNLLNLLQKDSNIKTNLNGDIVTSKWTMNEHTLKITSLSLDQTGSKIFSSSLDRTVKIVESLSGAVLLSVMLPCSAASSISDTFENFLFMGGSNGIIYQMSIGSAAAKKLGASLNTISLNIIQKPSCSSSRLFKSSILKENPLQLEEFLGHTKEVTDMKCLSNGSSLASCSMDGYLRVWHIVSRQCLQVLSLSSGGLSQIIVTRLPISIFESQGNKPKQLLPIAPLKKDPSICKESSETPFSFPVLINESDDLPFLLPSKKKLYILNNIKSKQEKKPKKYFKIGLKRKTLVKKHLKSHKRMKRKAQSLFKN